MPATTLWPTPPQGAKVSYLNSDLTPKQAQEAGYAGIDYEDKVWRAHPTWIKEAKQLGLITNEPVKAKVL